MRLVATLLLGISTVIPATAARAEYPQRPITMIIPFAPGGGADITARTLAPFIAKHLPGASIVPLNRAGAGGEIGFTEIAQAVPDGYTIGAINTPSVVMKPYEHKTKYTKDDFTLIANLALDPSAIAVRADSPIKSVEDLIAALKKDPKSVVAGTAGIGSEDHLLLTRFGTLIGLKVTTAPFKSSGEALIALKGGHVGMTVVNSAVSSKEEGAIRILAVASDTRWKQRPDVPTFRELGISLLGGSARGYGGPKGMPQEAVAALSKAIKAAVEDPEFLAQAAKQELPIRYMDSDEYRKFVDAQDKDLAAQWAADPWIK
jgi:tripartite-type tricarboxylate transporter receptor subunit TctC